MQGINSKPRGVALLAVIAFVVLTVIIAEAFLIYFYNQYRITMQKIIYEKAFYYALGAIELGKVLIKTGGLAVNGTRTIKNWGGSPEFDLRYINSQDEYPEAPINYFKIELRRTQDALGNDILTSYAYSEISSGTEVISTVRKVNVTLDAALAEISWQEISPALSPAEEANIYN